MINYQELAARVERGEIKALSIKQPYPHHIFHDGKDVENRDWPTRGRGWIIVHAGVSKTEIDKHDPKEMAMPRGGIVGMARITDCVEKIMENIAALRLSLMPQSPSMTTTAFLIITALLNTHPSGAPFVQSPVFRLRDVLRQRVLVA